MKNWQKSVLWLTVIGSVVFVGSCTVGGSEAGVYRKGKVKMSVSKEVFGKTAEGEEVDVYRLVNANGVQARIMTYGGVLLSLEVPDNKGRLGDVVLGHDRLEKYLAGDPYFGAIVGRYGNRIGKGKFTLDGVAYQLATNNGENHLHGGLKGFDKVVWGARAVREADAVGVRLNYMSVDGEEGYPGNLSCVVTYRLTNEDELKIDYEATTDKATPVNLTHHSYFNLAGQGWGEILNHELMLMADKFTPVDKGLIPTGELRSVKGTPMDFTRPTKIGSRITAEDEQLKFGGGYDHNFVLNSGGRKLALAARVYEALSGRVMEVYTTEPGIQFYSGNFLDGTDVGKGGKVYNYRNGFCLETQHFPDSPNKAEFPSAIVRPGKKLESETIYKFYVKCK